MSRRQRSIITISIRLPVPAGVTQKQALEQLDHAVKTGLSTLYNVNEIILRIERRETVYL